MADLRGLFDERVVIVIVIVMVMMKRGVRMRVSCFIDTRLEVISVALGPKRKFQFQFKKGIYAAFFILLFA
jgi:hypothetical protein